MPKQVDQDERRRRIVEAICQLAHEQGIEGVTLRDVAARAGLSMGAVQRTFASRDDMLTFALDSVGERLVARLKEQRPTPRSQTPQARLAHLATEVALLDPARHSEAAVWLVFAAQAAVVPRLSAILRAKYAELDEAFERLLRDAGVPAKKAKAEARILLSLVDGLTLHVLWDRLSPRAAQELLRAHLLRVVTPPGEAA